MLTTTTTKNKRNMRDVNLVIKDTEKLQKEKLKNKIDIHEEQKRMWMEHQLQHCVFMENDSEDPTNIQQQIGQMMTAADLEERLKKLTNRLVFEYNPINPLMKAIYILKDGKKEYFCSYHGDIMPEHSIVKVKKEVVWDPDYKEPLKRTELPKHKWVPGKGYEFEGIPPGWKEVVVPWGEIKRGWRTILIKLVKEGILTVTQAENFVPQNPTSAFGQKAWSHHLGKRKGNEIPF